MFQVILSIFCHFPKEESFFDCTASVTVVSHKEYGHFTSTNWARGSVPFIWMWCDAGHEVSIKSGDAASKPDSCNQIPSQKWN